MKLALLWGSKFAIFNFCFFFFWLCFKGLNIAHCFWFLPMQFNPLGIALVQYMYTLYMHVWFCLCKLFFLFGNIQIRCLPLNSFLWQFSVMLFTADFSCFPAVLLVVHEVAELMKCLAIYFWLALKLYSSWAKGYQCNFKTLFYRLVLSWKCHFWYFKYTYRVINSNF